MKTLIALVVTFLTMNLSGFAQTKSMRFPQFADGKFSDGTYYRSTVIITPRESDAPTCNLQLYGMTALLGNITIGNLTINVPFGSYYATQTAGTQSYQGGYASLDCSDPVFALVLYSFYSANNIKISEATVFPSSESSSFRILADHRDGARLGLALANNTDVARSYTVSVGSRTATIQVPSRRSLAKFVDELISFSNNEVSLVTIRSSDLSDFSVIGLRFTGSAFTTIPAN